MAARKLGWWIGVGLLLVGSPIASGQGMTFTPLGFLPDSFYSDATAVSADGSVVVGFNRKNNGDGEAYRWTQGTGMVGLGDFAGGSFYSTATGVSADGSLVVGYGSTISGFGDRPFRWTQATGLVALPLDPNWSFSRFASGVSADGAVVAGYRFSANGPEGFRWSSGSGYQGVGGLPGGSFFSSTAWGISADGSVLVGESNTTGDVNHAFRWTAGTGIVDLGTLPGGNFSAAVAVSGDGQTVVGWSHSATGYFAMKWTSAAGMVSLGGDGTAYGVSADGSIIVGDFGTGTGRAALWSSGGGIQNIRDLLVADGINMTGWTLTNATAISADGRTIVGFGNGPNGTEGWRVTLAAVPEPTTLLLLGLAGVGTGIGVWHRRRIRQAEAAPNGNEDPLN